MTTHAYSQLYLSKASRTVGNMFHDAVVEFGIDGTDFLKRFIQSDVAEQFESGNPKYIAGKSGLELFLEVIEKTEAYEGRAEILNIEYTQSEDGNLTPKITIGSKEPEDIEDADAEEFEE